MPECLRRTIDVQLPDPTPTAPVADAPSIVLELDETGGYAINHSSFSRAELSARIHAIYDHRPDKVLFVKGSPKVKYAAVIDAMDVARGAGVKLLGLP